LITISTGSTWCIAAVVAAADGVVAGEVVAVDAVNVDDAHYYYYCYS
jgi:hypothetical protein